MEAVILPAIKVAATAYAVYNVVEGIKEGNILQAVLGGIGAFTGISHLASAAAQGTAGGAAAGTMVGPDSVSQLAAEAGGVVPEGALTSAMEASLGEGVFGLSGVAGTAPGNTVLETAGLGVDVMAPEVATDVFQGMGAATDAAQAIEPFTNTAATGLAPIEGAPSGALEGLDVTTALDQPFAGAGITAGSAPQASGGLSGFFNDPMGTLGRIPELIQENPQLAQMGAGMLQGWQQQQMWEDYQEDLRRRRRRRGQGDGRMPRYKRGVSGRWQRA